MNKSHFCLFLGKAGSGKSSLVISFLNSKEALKKCFHNYVIKAHKKLNEIGFCEDKTIEFYKIKNKKIYGMMWHPERDYKFKNFNKMILRRICS